MFHGLFRLYFTSEENVFGVLGYFWTNGKEDVEYLNNYINDYFLSSTKYKYLGLKKECNDKYLTCVVNRSLNGNYRYTPQLLFTLLLQKSASNVHICPCL